MAPVQPQRRDGQLPAEVTGFVGREAELAHLTALLAHARIVTVTGYGGVGKTRLALRAVDRSAHVYPGGVVLLDLASVRDPALLLPALAAAVGISRRDLDQDAQLDMILSGLRHLRVLLIWDTCEHLIEPCARLAELILRHAAGVTILTTSRQPLDVPGEYVISVPPLPVAGVAAGADSGSAVELLAQRAGSLIPGFSVTGNNRPAMIALCQRLDGIPLAIELAALRMRALPLEELAAADASALDGTVPATTARMLSGARRTSVARHQTIQESIEWSRALCTPAERTVWTRLSVFGGSFDLAAAETVCGGDLRAGQVTEAVIGLVDKSVLLREPPTADLPRATPATTAVVGEPATRYRLPHAARESGGELLIRTQDGGAVVRERYVAYWTTAAEHFASHVADDQLSQYRVVDRERANLTAACGHALAVEGASYAARLTVALSMYWVISGRLREGRHWLDEAAARQYPPRERARVLAGRALLAGMAGDMKAALADAEASIALADDAATRGRAHLVLHRALSWSGDLAGAARAASRAVPALEEAGDVIGLAQLDAQAGMALLPAAPQEAAEICARALGRLPAAEVWLTGSLLGIMGLAQYRGHDLDAATETFLRVLVMKRELGSFSATATNIAILGFLAGAQGQHERAVLLLGATTPLWEAAGTRYRGIAFLEDLHRKTVRAALDNLGEAAYASFREAGEAMPPDEAITLASRLDIDPGLASRAAPWHHEGASAAPVGPLTGREVQIAALVASGLSNREIAVRITVSKRTVDAHVDHIFTKLRISSRIQLTNWLRDRVPSARSGQDSGERPPRPYP